MTGQQLANELGAPVFAPTRPVAGFSDANIITVDKSSWRQRFDSELQTKLFERPDIAVGWRTFVRNLDAVDLLLSLDEAVSFLGGVFLSFGNTVDSAEIPENIEKMTHVAELLIASSHSTPKI